MKSAKVGTMDAVQHLRPSERFARGRKREANGEIRVAVRLVKAVDEVLARRGQIPPAQVRSLDVKALVDTAVVRSVIPAPLLAGSGW